MAVGNTILAVGTPKIMERVSVAATIYPGMLVEIDSSNLAAVHSTSAGPCAALIALEDEYQGKEISDNYAITTKVRIGAFKPGDQCYVRLANGQTTAIGNFLDSNGDGYVKVITTVDSGSDLSQPSSVKFMALEVVDMSGSTGADPTDLVLCLVV